MKNLITIFLLSASLLGCVENQSPERKPKADAGNTEFDPIAHFENSNHRISLDQSEALYANFQSRFSTSIERIQLQDVNRANENYDPTEYVLVNIDTLQAYIDFLKAVEKKNGGGDKKITGIAFFLGANDKNKTLADKKSSFNELDAIDWSTMTKDTGEIPLGEQDIRGRITTFMVPTFRTNNSNSKTEVARHIPFYISPKTANDPFVGDYKSLLERFDSSKNAKASLWSSFSSVLLEGTSLSANEFTNIPPNKPGVN